MLGSGSFSDAKKQFEKKFKDKSGLTWANRLDSPKANKYTFVERNYESSDDEGEDEDTKSRSKSRRGSVQSNGTVVESKLAKPVQRLMEFIFNQQYFDTALRSMSYDANKLPLGRLSKRTVGQGFEILKELAAVIADPTLSAAQYNTNYGDCIADLSGRYYSVIPHAFGRSRPPPINSPELIKREVDLLETLTDMQLSNEIMKETAFSEQGIHSLDRQYAGLGMEEMAPLEPEATEFKMLSDYLIKSAGSTHGIRYRVQDIFRITRKGESSHSVSVSNPAASDRRLLWHGSRSTNYGGILSQGLRIAPPEAPVSGYMFGKGVYLADISTKSANYCWASSSGNVGLLLLCEAELGKPMLELKYSSYSADQEAKAIGGLSTWGKGRYVPKGWKDAGCVHESLKGVTMVSTTFSINAEGTRQTLTP